MSSDTILAIRKTYVKENESEGVKLENIGVGKKDYYGTYGNCIAVKVWDINEGYTAEYSEILVDGIQFTYRNGNRIKVYLNK